MSDRIVLPLDARIAVAIVRAIPAVKLSANGVDAMVDAVHDVLARELASGPSSRVLMLNEDGRLQVVNVEVVG